MVAGVGRIEGEKEKEKVILEASVITTEDEDNKNGDTGTSEEISDAELSKIVAEMPLDDPLNAFYDPYEPYRLLTFAYWRPITYPDEHKNPPLPTGFIPCNVPPKSFPADFFLHDDEAKELVQNEHAASFCPFLRRWRRKHPLKAYPVGPDFLQNHPAFKFIPGRGYEVDVELENIKRRSRSIEQGILNKAAKERKRKGNRAQQKSESDRGQTLESDGRQKMDSEDSQPPTSTNTNISTNRNKKRRDPYFDLKILLKIIDHVKKIRSDCQNDFSFTEPLPSKSVSFRARANCLHEVIIRMEEKEDMHSHVDRSGNFPEIANKYEYFRQILLKMNNGKGLKKGEKCPFGFGTFKNSEETHLSAASLKVYRGAIPDWAKLKPGEEIFSLSNDSEKEKDDEKEKYSNHNNNINNNNNNNHNHKNQYLFSYKQVPFPSIQDTLKKYVGL